MSLRVRRYTPADEDALFHFRQKIFPTGHKSLDRDHFTWKFLKHPYAKELPFFIMEDNDKIVGTQGYWPFLLNMGKKSITCGHLVDFNVEEAYRGLPTLKLFKAVCSCSELNFGAYISSDARRFFKAANWVDISSHLKNYYSFLHMPTKAGIAGKARYLCSSLVDSTKQKALLLKATKYDFIIESNLPCQAEQVISHSAIDDRYCFVKEKKFLVWRYEEAARTKYKFASIYHDGKLKCFLIYNIIKDFEMNRCFIMDIIHSPDETYLVKILLVQLSMYLKKNTDVLVLQSAALPTLGDVFISCGYRSNTSKVGFMLSNNCDGLMCETKNLSKFNFILGDTDFL